MVLAMAMVVLDVVTLGFQRVVVFIFDLPSAAPGRNDLQHIPLIERQGSRKGVVIQHLTVLVSGRELTPVNPQGVIAIAQGNRRGVAIRVDLAPLAGPASANHAVDSAAPLQKLQPLVYIGMGLRPADEDESKSSVQRVA